MMYTITNMIETLGNYKHDKTELMRFYIEARLTKSFNLYSKELQQSVLFLTRKHEKSLVKRMKKLDDSVNR